MTKSDYPFLNNRVVVYTNDAGEMAIGWLRWIKSEDRLELVFGKNPQSKQPDKSIPLSVNDLDSIGHTTQYKIQLID